MSITESVTYQAILREGEAKGEAKGKAEGESKGAIAEARKILVLQGTHLFGAPDAQIMAAVDAMGDLEQLEALIVRVPSVRSWQELIEAPAPRRRGRRRDS